MVADLLLSSLDIGGLVVDLTRILVDMLFAKLYLKGLELNLFRKKVKLAVVSHIVELLFVAGNLALRVLDLLLLLSELHAQLLDLRGVVGDAGAQTLQVVLEVLHLQRQLAADDLDTVDFGKDGLELIERTQTALH